MTRLRLITKLSVLCLVLAGCSLFLSDENQSDQYSTEQIDSYTAEMISEGFEFCPESYLEIEISQFHENPEFNFLNEVYATGELSLEIFGTDRPAGLQSKAEIPLQGNGQAGVCQFISSGIVKLDIIGRLIPGEKNQPNILFIGQCDSSVQSKPPCGDFGMIPLEKKVWVVLPYQDGGSFEWEWKNYYLGVSGRSKWTLNIPCDR